VSKYLWLSKEWIDESAKLAEGQPERQGATARIQYRIEGGPDGNILYYWIIENGKLIESDLGELDGSEITLVQNYDDAVKIQKLQLDANAAFMQGRMKVEGNIGKLMSLLPVTNSPEYRQLQKDILEITQF
ncbi:unnamed protein product, partial [Acidithrix sp. C25]|jgi:putative sterol carrier protein